MASNDRVTSPTPRVVSPNAWSPRTLTSASALKSPRSSSSPAKKSSGDWATITGGRTNARPVSSSTNAISWLTSSVDRGSSPCTTNLAPASEGVASSERAAEAAADMVDSVSVMSIEAVLLHAVKKRSDARTMTNRRRNTGYLREAIRSGNITELGCLVHVGCATDLAKVRRRDQSRSV